MLEYWDPKEMGTSEENMGGMAERLYVVKKGLSELHSVLVFSMLV